MARSFTSGFESRNLAYEVFSTTGSPSISNDVYFKGVASMRCNAAGGEVSAKMFTNTSVGIDMLHRAYFKFVTFPASLTKIVQIVDNGGDNTSIRVNSDGTLELWDDSSVTQSGSDSSALSAGTWYRIELAAGTTIPGNDVQARIDGTEFANKATAAAGANHRAVEYGIMGSVTSEVYIDSAATNDTTGSVNTSWPGEDFSLSKTLTNNLRPAIFTPGVAR